MTRQNDLAEADVGGHVVERRVDLRQWVAMGDQLIDRKLAVLVHLDVGRNVPTRITTADVAANDGLGAGYQGCNVKGKWGLGVDEPQGHDLSSSPSSMEGGDEGIQVTRHLKRAIHTASAQVEDFVHRSVAALDQCSSLRFRYTKDRVGGP